MEVLVISYRRKIHHLEQIFFREFMVSLRALFFLVSNWLGHVLASNTLSAFRIVHNGTASGRPTNPWGPEGITRRDTEEAWITS